MNITYGHALDQHTSIGRVLGIDPDSIYYGIRQGQMDPHLKINGLGSELTDTSYCQG